MNGYPRGQYGVILPARDCLLCFHNNILRKFKRVHESFVFRDSSKIFCDFSVRMELENEKTETHHLTFAFNWLPFQCSKINNYKDHFFQCSLRRIINLLLLTKLVGSRWLEILGLFSFCVFMDLDFPRVHENAKRELG